MTGIAVDIGGSQIRAARFTMRGDDRTFAGEEQEGPARGRAKLDKPRMDAVVAMPTRAPLDPEDLLAVLRPLMDAAVRCVGVSVAGVVAVDRRTVVRAMNLGWSEVALGRIVEDEFGVPATVDTDAFVAATAEARFGAARGCRTALYVTVGTGIGHALLLDGRPVRGADGGANVLGHLCVEPAGAVCYCGLRGCLCQYASGRGIERLAEEAGHAVPAAGVVRTAAAGEAWAVAVLDRATSSLAAGLAAACTLANPGLVVLGGGAVTSGWPALAALRRRTQQTVHPSVRGLTVVRGRLGGGVGLVGAALLSQEGRCGAIDRNA